LLGLWEGSEKRCITCGRAGRSQEGILGLEGSPLFFVAMPLKLPWLACQWELHINLWIMYFHNMHITPVPYILHDLTTYWSPSPHTCDQVPVPSPCPGTHILLSQLFWTQTPFSISPPCHSKAPMESPSPHQLVMALIPTSPKVGIWDHNLSRWLWGADCRNITTYKYWQCMLLLW